MTELRALSGVPELLSLSNNDSHIRAVANPERLHSAWAHFGGAYAWVMNSNRFPDRLLATIHGPRRSAGQLLVVLREDVGVPVGSVTLPRDGDRVLPASYVLRPRNDWEWFVTSSPPAEQRHEAAVMWLDSSCNEDLTTFLQRWSPRHDARPGSSIVRRWCAVRARNNEFVAVAAHVEYVPGVPHLASIATSGDYRGQGYGAAVTAWITRTLLDEGTGIVTLGMYSDNDMARRMYLRLGYRREHEFPRGAFSSADGSSTVPEATGGTRAKIAVSSNVRCRVDGVAARSRGLSLQ